jgi:diguanylate cyclase (GGDEF)-like protein
MSIRMRLAVVVMATLIPAFITCWLAIRSAFESEEQAIEVRVLEATKSLAMVVDQEMNKQLVVANMLARATETSAAMLGPSGQADAFFRAVAQSALGEGQWATVSSLSSVVLSTRSGAPQVESAARLQMDYLTQPAKVPMLTKNETFSALMHDSASGGWISRVQVAVPALREGGNTLRLSVASPAAVYQRIVESQQLPPDWTLAIVDSNGMIAARKPNGSRWVGKPATATLARQLQAGNTGPFQSVSLDGVETVAFASQSSVTGWAFVIAVPRISYGSVIGRSASRMYGVGAFLLLASLTTAIWMASKIHRPVTALWRQAKRLQEGRPVRFRETGGKECNAVSQALAAASRKIEGTRVELETRVTLALNEAATARVDGLTGLANRRHFDESLQKEESLSLRKRAPLTLIMIDVDHFKAYNDLYGHLEGDECLKKISLALSLVIRRPSDLLARYGGEEMVFLLPDTDACGAAMIAESARSAVQTLAQPHGASLQGIVTVSVGYASAIADGPGSARRLLLQADNALYASKHTGRNKCSMWHDALLVQESVRQRLLGVQLV